MTKAILTEDNIILNQSLGGKEEAIRFTGDILVKNGYVEKLYVDKMLEREEVTSTYIGNHVAIPHGTEDAKSKVKETGLSIVTVPEGIDFGNGNVAKILVGIAGKGNEHLEILSKIALVVSEEANIQKILEAKSKDEILNMFNEVN
ncbi:PTS sugar transporter subunit IIA [Aquibacillus sp. 3ASR75-11]|uniref:Mannitol-specific phosphotransferase enzyme IIA component n=1 Tax=Terrihalobacillus insolitus TaxID=2950438 RepID=A0A9X4AM99_9BACI|nr:PTS sugar transporter subunit IIA [Terrihalobacillus insolitus]MDC3412007.1 PTS sugar transporter subunit IIA [Terrihalobacillus insolitus]MDC3423308.1 PTS sugar transporter subunit IIA [Terrihalobacillus insolitus]